MVMISEWVRSMCRPRLAIVSRASKSCVLPFKAFTSVTVWQSPCLKILQIEFCGALNAPSVYGWSATSLALRTRFRTYKYTLKNLGQKIRKPNLVWGQPIVARKEKEKKKKRKKGKK